MGISLLRSNTPSFRWPSNKSREFGKRTFYDPLPNPKEGFLHPPGAGVCTRFSTGLMNVDGGEMEDRLSIENGNAIKS
jgi:hypothetical protein